MIKVEKKYLDKLTETFYHMQRGERVEALTLPEEYPDNELKQVYDYCNRFIESQNHIMDFIDALSRGELAYEPPKGSMAILQPFKSLQSSLKHLTWVTEQIAAGDFDHHVDFMGAFSNAFNEMTRQLKEAFEEIKAASAVIEKDKERIKELLYNVLPEKTIEELDTTGRTTPRVYDNVTVFMSDIVGFTKQSLKIDPVMLIDELNSMFSEFDEIVKATGGERIKTIGDAFLAVWGMHTKMENHAQMATEASLKIIDFLEDRNDKWVLKWQVRIGLHTGSVVGGVVGNTKFIYDIFGDTVNTASRMESNSEPMRINVSEDIYHLIKDNFDVEDRGTAFVKGKGYSKMYFVNKKKE